jgi:predicted dehydrogenase
MKIRVGVVGCGLVAQVAHLRYLQELSHLFEIRALCDLSPKVVGQLGRRFNVPHCFLDYRELVAEELDAVLVLTRDHAPVALAAAERGLHLLVEKPLCFNLEEADEILHAARSHGVKLMVGYMKRYDPAFERALEILATMEGGLIRVHNSVGSPNPITEEMYDLVRARDLREEELATARVRNDASLLQAIGVGRRAYLTAYSLLLHLWSHNINLLRGAFGEPGGINYAEIRPGRPVGELPALQILAILEYGPETAALWETRAFVASKWWDEELAFFGSEQTVRLSFPFPYAMNTPTVLRVQETADGALIQHEIIASYDEAYKRELQHFYDCVANDREPLTNGEDAKRDLELAIGMVRACAPRGTSSA